MNYLLDRAGIDTGASERPPAPPTWAATEPTWLRALAGRDAPLERLVATCVGPHPSDATVEELARDASTGASRVFLVHGNVRDYAFHPRVGFAPLPDVLARLWRDGVGFDAMPSEVVLVVSAAVGVELLDEAAAPEAVQRAVREQRDRVRALGHEERVQADLALVDTLVRGPQPALVLVERADLLFPADSDAVRTANRIERVLRWASRPAATLGRSVLVLFAESVEDVHAELRKRVNGVQSVAFPRPRTAAERLRFLVAAAAAVNGVVDLPGTRLTPRLSGWTPRADELEEVAAHTTGLNLAGLEACLLTLPRDATLSAWATKERERLLRAESQGLLVVEEPKEVALVGRLAQLADELAWVAGAMREGRRELVPMGMLFVGVPGTGKSYLASGLAARCRDAGVQYVRLGDFRDMWVGSTERNFSRALELIATFGRVIVFMDEIDQSEGGSRGEGRHETSRRVFGKLLEFMAEPEHRGNVLWIAATNRPDQLDPAIVRPGRFDLVVSFRAPDECECVEILAQKLAGVGATEVSSGEGAAECARRGLVGAEIELVVTEAARLAARKGRSLDEETLLDVIRRFRDDYKATPQYRAMQKACARFVRFDE